MGINILESGGLPKPEKLIVDKATIVTPIPTKPLGLKTAVLEMFRSRTSSKDD